MSDETNLSGMDLTAAREYVFGYMTSLKQLDQELARLQGDMKQWTKRAALAAANGGPDLQAAANAKVAELGNRHATLTAERADLAAKVARMREQLPMLRMSERSVDADRLLAELQMMTGELLNPGSADAERELRNAGADAALEELKRKMGRG